MYADLAVDDDHAHVRPIAGVVDREPAQLSQPRDFDARCRSESSHDFVEMLRSERVDEKQHANLRPRPLLENRRQRVGDLSRQRVVHLHRDGVLRRSQVGPKPRIDAVAVQRLLDRVAGEDMRAR